MTEFKDIIERMLEAYAHGQKIQVGSIREEMSAAFETEGDLMAKVRAMDEVFDRHPMFEDLRELFFDMLMIRFLAIDSSKLAEGYLESQEWAKIEEKTIDRGTEALNIFLYLAEAQDAEVKPSLDDFLNEFLLVDDDLYQDEIDIYEAIIQNQDLVDATAEEIIEADAEVQEAEMKEIFLPLMLFFNTEIAESEKEILIAEKSKTPGLHLALFEAIRGFGKKSY